MLPESIIKSKKKVGFNASIMSQIHFTKGKNKDWLLSDSKIFNVINKNKFEIILKRNFSKNDFSKFIFNFISSKIFLEKFS